MDKHGITYILLKLTKRKDRVSVFILVAGGAGNSMGRLYSTLILLSLIWGTSFLFMKILLLNLTPIAIVFGRCFFGTMMLAIIIFIKREKINYQQLPWGKLFLVALTNNALPWLLICSSETKITSSLASCINATTPIFTLLIGYFFFSTALKKNHWIGIVIGLFGILVLSEVKLNDLFTSNTMGVLLMSGAALCYGLGTQFSHKYLSHLSVYTLSFFTIFLSTVISFVAMLSFNPHSLQGFEHSDIYFPLIGLGSFGSGIAYLFYYYLVKKGSPEFASLVTYLVPVSAIIWGAVILKESIHFSILLGLLFIFTGIYISSKKSKLKKKSYSIDTSCKGVK